ncbi:hypothetical protein L484_015136 [Morus notabilis]|uniref:Uncharacterized protein n=1 Tax=Morus notabilis TaxID=981085 RepID=W9S719_9ROSA|nr:putative UPF0481 protein At3g02645 [Morus notabilis]EXC29943.1 hypothetical protein L484_015136 [Morus notabilis]
MAEKTENFDKTITDIFNKDDIDVPISIFKVPNSITSSKPEAYAPQLVGLGPVHHLRHELQNMQMYKVVEAKRIHKGFQSLDFEKLVEFLKQIAVPSVRASYNIYLDMEDEVLACVMAVDGLFLFGLLCCCGINMEALANSSSLCHLVNFVGRILAQETAIQEAMMLENQIPIFVLKVILIAECSQVSHRNEIVSNLFPKILFGFCEFFSPFKIVENYPLYKAIKRAHLLDLLYHLVTLKHSSEWNSKEEEEELRSIEELYKKVRSEILVPVIFPMCMKTAVISDQIVDLVKEIAPPELQKPIELVQGLLELPWSDLMSSIPLAAKEEVPAKEISFPRASELNKSGVKFFVADHITTIRFDPNTVSFHLPFTRLNVNFEVVLRNLGAYEAMVKSEKEPLILNGFVELMNGLIKSADDVMVLKDQGIISKPESINDEKVAKIFSEMNKLIELTNTPDLDMAIEGVTNYYNSLWKVSACKFMNKWRRTVRKWCKVFAVLLILLLMNIQTFCSVFECPRFSFKINYTSEAQQGLRLPSFRSYM